MHIFFVMSCSCQAFNPISKNLYFFSYYVSEFQLETEKVGNHFSSIHKPLVTTFYQDCEHLPMFSSPDITFHVIRVKVMMHVETDELFIFIVSLLELRSSTDVWSYSQVRRSQHDYMAFRFSHSQ